MEEERLDFRDYPALVALSLRSCFWSAESLPNLGNMTSPAVYYTVLATVLLGASGYFILDGFMQFLMQLKVSVFLIRILIFGALLFLCFDYRYALYNLNYCKRSWWRDTKIHPYQICSGFTKWETEEGADISDRVGLYGEYLASMAAEYLILKEKDLTGYVLNGALIPVKNQRLFAESDLISVSEYGIHVIEVKNWRGALMGNLNDPEWDGGRHNPFYQNLYHTNMLYDYLYENLPEGTLKHRNLNEIMRNVVLFTTPFLRDELDKGNRFYRSYAGYTQNYLYLNGYISDGFRGERKVLTKEEAATIAGVIWKLVYPDTEKKKFMERRKEASQNGAWKESPSYDIVEILAPDIQGELHKATVIRRKRDGHYAYYDFNDWRFRALPNCRVISDSPIPVRLKHPVPKQFEACPKEARALLQRVAEGKNLWFNDAKSEVAYMESGSEAAAGMFKIAGVQIMNWILFHAEKLLKFVEGILLHISMYLSFFCAVLGALVYWQTKDYRIILEALFLVWFVSPLGILSLFLIGLKALSDFNRYTHRILKNDLK